MRARTPGFPQLCRYTTKTRFQDFRFLREHVMSEDRSHGVDGLARSIDWKQGLAIALGVPLLILPSLGYLPMYLEQ